MRWMMSSSLAMAHSTRFLRLKKNKPNTHRLCKSLRRRRRRLLLACLPGAQHTDLRRCFGVLSLQPQVSPHMLRPSLCLIHIHARHYTRIITCMHSHITRQRRWQRRHPHRLSQPGAHWLSDIRHSRASQCQSSSQHHHYHHHHHHHHPKKILTPSRPSSKMKC